MADGPQSCVLEQVTNGIAVYLSSVSASMTPPWPGLGAYAVSKAALDKLVEAWRMRGFTLTMAEWLKEQTIGKARMLWAMIMAGGTMPKAIVNVSDVADVDQ